MEQESLTNEFVRKKFKSQFELVNYAIKLSEQLIRSGRAPRVPSDNQNPAVIVIEEIEEGRDQLESLIDDEPKTPSPAEIEIKDEAIEMHVKPERKKARRILA